MSSMPCSYTGMRLKPAAMTTSMASATVARASMATMSGRGTITSRTTVSPNSMIEWMSWRSSRSITSSSTATSARASSSSSDTNGPVLQALAGEDHVGQADQAPGQQPQRREAARGGHQRGGEQGGPLGVLHGPGLGHRLGEHEDHDHLEGGGDGDADRAEESLGHDTDERGGHQVAAAGPAAGPG